MDFLFRVFAIAVKDGVCQRLPEREFDGEFTAWITMEFPNLEHKLINEG
jgi:hypothetical protein